MAQVQERRPASNRAPGGAPRPPEPPNRLAGLIARHLSADVALCGGSAGGEPSHHRRLG